MSVQLEEQTLGRPEFRIAEMLPGAPGAGRSHPPVGNARALGFLNCAGNRDQKSLAGSEVVQQHGMAGADGRRELAQAQIGDPGAELPGRHDPYSRGGRDAHPVGR